jgi:hypothetical protein
LKPGGNFKVFSGISLAGVAVILPANGASFELDISAPIPCFHAGAGAGLGASATGAEAVVQPCKLKIEDINKMPANGMSFIFNEFLFCII